MQLWLTPILNILLYTEENIVSKFKSLAFQTKQQIVENVESANFDRKTLLSETKATKLFYDCSISYCLNNNNVNITRVLLFLNVFNLPFYSDPHKLK